MLFYFVQKVDTKRVIYIPQGGINSIITYLDKKSYQVNGIDNIILRFLGKPQSGYIDLKSKSMSKLDFLYKLTVSKAAMQSITLIPGETYYFFLQDLAQQLQVSQQKVFQYYAAYAFKKDGNILADTYSLPIGMDEKELILHLLEQTDKRYETLSKKIFGIYEKNNWYRYITIASVIQKEAANHDEMPLISSVIYNRLRKGMPLQMDGTLNYSLYSHTKVTKQMIQEDKSDYNTYLHKKLPSNPICAVELESIKSAIFPIQSDYLYFIKNQDGTGHNFSDNYNQHKKNIAQLSQQPKPSSVKKRNTTEKHDQKTPPPKRVQIAPKRYKIEQNDLKSLWN